MSGAPNDDGASTSGKQLASEDGALDDMNPDPGGSSAFPFDDMAAWLRYPMEDSFEKHYCSDLFGQWPPFGTHIFKETVFTDPMQSGFDPPDSEQEGCPESSGDIAFSGSVALVGAMGGGNGGTSSLVRSNSADAALALGADRAAGLIDTAGFEAFSKVRTSMQPWIPKASSPSFGLPRKAGSFPARSSCPSSFTERASLTSMVTPAMVSPMLPPRSRSQGSYLNKLPLQPTSKGFRNFANFSWPSAVLMADLQGAGLGTGGRKQNSMGLAGASSGSTGFSLTEPSSTIMDKKFDVYIDSSVAQSSCFSKPDDKAAMIPVKSPRDEASSRSSGVDASFTVTHLDISRKSKSPGSGCLEPERMPDTCELVEIAMASNSGDSQTSADRSMKELGSSGKRKLEDFECQSEDAEEDSTETKHTQIRATSKRSRAAEIHNLSERRRRNRINEKMRVLRELIPNSNKTDKASTLDEAIEYVKALQLQLQMMSVRTGMNLSPTVMPAGTPQMQMPQMASMHPMGMAMTVGIPGMGMRMDFSTGMGRVDLSHSFLRQPSEMLTSCLPMDSTVIAVSSDSCIQAYNVTEYPPIQFSGQLSTPVQQQLQEQSQHSIDSIGNPKDGSPQ